jgi:hypothetical protein
VQALPHRLATFATAPVMQLAKVHVRKNDDVKVNNTISGVTFGSRPPSNIRGTQGQHVTAFVAFQDAVLSHVRDKTPVAAAGALIGLLDQFKELPGMLSQPKYIVTALATNQQLLGDVATSDDPAGMLGDLIDNVLAIRNAIPLTAVTTHEGGGHGEAKSAGGLEVLETAIRTGAPWPDKWGTADEVAAQSQFYMWRLLDYDPPSPGTDDEKLAQIGRHLLGHFLSMRMAYPGVWHWLSTKKEYYLFTYLMAHRNDDGIPLRNLTSGELKALAEYVIPKM